MRQYLSPTIHFIFITFRPMSYITVGGVIADVGGNNDNSGGARLSGKYVQMSDKCGDSFMEGSNINWGTSGGDNCKFNSIQQLYQRLFLF